MLRLQIGFLSASWLQLSQQQLGAYLEKLHHDLSLKNNRFDPEKAKP